MTTQTPDAVREAANVAAFHAIYGKDTDPFTRPEAFGYASEVAGAVIAALDSRAGDAGEEIENGYTADDAVDFVFNRLAEQLGLADWQVVEGSEEWEGDVSATLHRLLIDAGIIDDETGAVATLATPAPAVDASAGGKLGWDEDGMCDDHGAFACPKCAIPVAVDAVPAGEVLHRATLNHCADLIRHRAVTVSSAPLGGGYVSEASKIAGRHLISAAEDIEKQSLAALSHGEADHG